MPQFHVSPLGGHKPDAAYLELQLPAESMRYLILQPLG